jgi:hypothetical protein
VRNRAEVIAMAEQLRADNAPSHSMSRTPNRHSDSKREGLSAVPSVVPLHPREG